jgi:hypothetical protein
VEIVPEHFVNTNFKYRFKVSVDGFRKDARDAQLVNVKAGCMAIIKDLWMSKTMNRWSVKVLLPFESCEEGLEKSPGVVEILFRTFPSDRAQVWQRKRPQHTIFVDP